MSLDQTGDARDFVDAFDQAPALMIALEGPRLVVTAWNQLGRQIGRPVFRALGESLVENQLLRGSQFPDVMLDVLRTGEPFTASEWEAAIPDADGTLRDHFFDFTYLPWRRPDGSVRGVIALAFDVTQKVHDRRALERDSAGWQVQVQSSGDALRALQASLLPPSVPVLPGVQIGARYLLAEAQSSAGGDWFSGIPLPDGRVGLVAGDVVGHGVAAAATMGQLRSVLRERLLSGAGIAGSLQALDRFAALTPWADAATTCVVALDAVTGEIEYCTAGHPPPLVVEGDRWRFLPLTGAGPLGSGKGFAVGHARVGMDGLLLLYTDGLVERPGREWEESLAEIGQVAANALAGWPLRVGAPTHVPDRVCHLCVDLLTRATGYRDDITVLAAHRIPLPTVLDVTLPASPTVVFDLVTELERWLSAIDAGDDDQRDLRLALVELVSNSVEHGLSERSDGELRLTAGLGVDGSVDLVLTDDGRWKDPDSEKPMAMPGNVALSRGLGLPLVAQLVGHLHIDHDGSGTQVRVRRRVSRPTSLFGADSLPRRIHRLDDELVVEVLPDALGTLSVTGPVLSETADSLRISLDVRTHGGTRAATLDLSEVTLLTSAGVRVLQQALRAAADQGAELTLVAGPDSPAHHVLTLVGLTHLTSHPERR